MHWRNLIGWGQSGMDLEFKLYFMKTGESMSILSEKTNHGKWPTEKLM